MIKVNHIEISEADIAAEMQYHPAENKRAAQVKAAESLVVGQLLWQRAKAIGIEMPEGKNAAELEAHCLDQLIEKEVMIPQATEAECEQYFNANREKFCSSAIVEARHILLAAAPDDIQARDEMTELANGLIKQLNDEPSKFDQLVQLYSSCPSKAQGGNLGQLSKGQTVPEFERVLLAVEPGLINYPIESRYGFHITFVERKIPGQPLTFAMAKSRIKQYLDEKVKRQAIGQYIALLASDAKIDGFEINGVRAE